MRRYQAVQARIRAEALDIFGAFHPDPADDAPKGCATLLLLGPYEPGFWPHVTTAPEFADGAPDPLDRWSARVVGALAEELDATPLFPFGAPARPFIRWALRSGRAWVSPVSMLVHDRAGLMLSYRGALALPERLELPPAPPCPCDGCAKPCMTACPVEAFAAGTYDLGACHGFLDTSAGADCMTRGCAARRACPVSRSYGRLPAQSAFHMARFHP
ncbi:MAG: ferredoxin [Paracoccaceae bacterium]